MRRYAQGGHVPNTRVQRTRSSSPALRSPLPRHPLGGRKGGFLISTLDPRQQADGPTADGVQA